MDRLQEAIAKARESWGSATISPKPHRRTTPLALAPTPLPVGSDPWPDLTALTPNERRLRAHRVVTLRSGPEAAPFDRLATKISQTMRDRGWKRLAITSPHGGSGKSTLTLNLAFSLSRQPDVKAVVAECDLRRPYLADPLGELPQGCISQVLAGDMAFADQALCHRAKVAFSLCRSPLPEPAAHLHPAMAGQHLAVIEGRFRPDLLLMDLPPMLDGGGMMAFAPQVDCVLLVAEAGRTTAEEIDQCERDLAQQTNVMGVVLNKCRHG